MENQGTAEEKLKHITEYIDVQVRMTKLKAVDKASGVASEAISGVVIGIILTLAVTIFTIAFAIYVSNLLGSYTKGFLLTSGILFLKALILFIFRKPLLSNVIRDRIIASLLSSN